VKLPAFFQTTLHQVESFALGVEKSVDLAENKLALAADRGLAKIAPWLEHDLFVVGNEILKTVSSTPNQALVKQETALIAQVNDPKTAPADRAAARSQLRDLMGAAPAGKTEPLPEVASPAAESRRSAEATIWDPAADAPGTAAQWATRDQAGKANTDPVNFYVHGNLADIVNALQAGGWSVANPNTVESAVDYKRDTIRYELEWLASKLPFLHMTQVPQDAYHAVNQMPLSDLYLDGRLPVLSMQANNHPLTGRDHFRIYWTGKKDAEGKNIYAISASRDAGLVLRTDSPSTGYMDHFTEPDADLERDFVLDTLKAGGANLTVRTVSRDFSAAPKGGLHSVDDKVYDVVIPGT
jgi:hypothetical protein